MHNLVAVLRASGLAVAVGAIAVAPALTCTTAASPRPVADYRAARIVVLGTLEQVAPDLVVRVETRYRGPGGDRVVLEQPDVISWCPFPYGAPAPGTQVLLAVVDEADWQWPNAALWAVEPDGSIVDAVAPWSGVPAPTSLAGALRAMGILPETATAGEPRPESPLAPLLAAAAGLAVMLVRLGGWRPMRRPERR